MSEEPNCHKCNFLTREYDYNDCEYTFLYSCLYTAKIVLTTKELQSVSDCHYTDGRPKPVKSYRLIPEDEYDRSHLQVKKLKDENKQLRQTIENYINVINHKIQKLEETNKVMLFPRESIQVLNELKKELLDDE